MASSGHDPGRRLKVAVLLHELGLSGGVAVLLGHVRRLAEHGIDARLVLTGEHPQKEPAEPPIQSFVEARRESWDVVVATWWETAPAMLELDAGCRVAFLQSLEERFYGDGDFLERLGASTVLGLPVHFLAVADWLRAVIETLRPDARCLVTRPGIDKERFRPRRDSRRREPWRPLQVLVEGQPELPFKAVPEAIAAVRSTRHPARVTLVAPEPSDASARLGADRVTGGLDADGMAALYAEHDVVLKLSRVEGLGLAPLEAMHVGVPAVLTPYTGHAEYARHGENCLVVGFDDVPGTVAALDRLAADRGLLDRLSLGAALTAASWPSSAQSTATFAHALHALADAPPPDAAAAAAVGLRRQRLALELGRAHLGDLSHKGRLGDEVPRLEAEILEHIGNLHRLGDELGLAQRELADIHGSPIHRAATVARGALRRVRR